MADELGKKPKTIGTPAPNVAKPKAEPASAPQQKMAPKQNASSFKGAKPQPGSPLKSESVPVGVQQTKFESPKHVNKRVDKMFKDTNQPTLGVWNKNNTNPMAKPDSVKFNPNLKYNPSKEQLEAANRKRIMQAGFGPTKGPDYYANSPKGYGDTSKKLSDWGNQRGIYVDEKSTKNYYDEEPDFWNVSGKKGGLYVFPNENGHYSVRSDVINQIADLENEDELFKYLEDWDKPEPEDENTKIFDDEKIYSGLTNQEADRIMKQDAAEEAQNSAPAPKPNSNPFKGKNNIPGFEGMDELWDNMMDSGQKVIDNNKQSKVDESEQRSKASELFGTDLNKSQGRDYDRLSQELDKGDFVNLDAGLLPYEHGFETSGHEDLAVDARKNPETGKYEVHMYPETEDGPVSGYEPGQNEPTYEFDTFDDLKAFMENGYKQPEVPQWNKDNNPGSVVVTKELQDWVRDYLTKQVGKDYADTVANNLANDNKVADFYKGLMKADWDKKHGK